MRIVNPTAVLGEDAACNYLSEKGYEIIERNFRRGYGEIDIIALFEKTLVFVEVKTRTSSKFGTPFEAISPWKLKTLIKAAQYYKYVLHPELPESIRFDAIGVVVSNRTIKKIEHLTGIT